MYPINVSFLNLEYFMQIFNHFYNNAIIVENLYLYYTFNRIEYLILLMIILGLI
jgi:hypothetical protein